MVSLAFLLFFMQAGNSDAVRLYREGQYAEAAAAYRELTRREPASAEAWAGLGKSLLRLHNAGAIPSLSRALQLKPGDAEVERTLARAYLEARNTGAAVSLLEPLTGRNPKDYEAVYLLGTAMYQGGFYHKALELLGQAMAVDHENSAAEAMYAVSLAKVGRTAESEAACRRILAKPAKEWDTDVALTFVEILDETDRAGEAVTYVDKVLYEHPQDPIAHFWKARLLLQSGRAEAAAKEAEQSVADAPNLPLARNLLIQIYRKQGRMREAQQEADWLREYHERLAAGGR